MNFSQPLDDIGIAPLLDTELRVLLVEDNPRDARLVGQLLAETGARQFLLTHVTTAAEALDKLAKQSFDAILLDLTLPDSQGLATATKIGQVTTTPYVILSGLTDDTLTLEAIKNGAQDYLIKGQGDGYLIARTIRYAIERQRLLGKIESLALFDELTGLYNRRGFAALADEKIKTADRTKQPIAVFCATLHDHNAATPAEPWVDKALIDAANVLRQTFRKSDLIARTGGEHFAIVASPIDTDGERTIVARLEKNADNHNTLMNRSYRISFCVGNVRYDPAVPRALEQLLAEAGAGAAAQKASRKA